MSGHTLEDWLAGSTPLPGHAAPAVPVIMPAVESVRGVAPHAGVTPPDPAVRLPARDVAPVDRPWLVGVTGGAGASTLAVLLGLPECPRAWPVSDDREQVLLVARSNHAGIAATRTAASEWASGIAAVDVIGVVFVADAPGRLPPPLARQIRITASVLPRSWRLPWVSAWRAGPPDPDRMPAAVSRLRIELSTITNGAHQ